ncbi:LOW QUALITY PROTEIN: hypothetical protein M514_09975 [Trichuris suis]|uniref:DUF4371 domain-containing protein n=1 Tax=Trichuris suis TaxID=68888 RepID=A0A085MY80_9BILA|nr:LOW QUALITY PROTEIN: hypothetical protein M514_09975 [Trichuris suis]
MNGLRASFNISLMIARSGKAHTIGEELLHPVLDESSLPGNEAILLAYVPFIKEEDLAQEFLFARELVLDSKGKSIFQVVEGYFKEKEIALTNVISVATDRAPSMVGCQRGFISYLKKVVPNVLAIRCEIHRQHLVAKCLSEPLHRSLQLVITAVNRIKSRPLSDRLFRQLCEENGEDFHRLLLHTEVSFGVLLEFFEEENASLCANLKKFEGDIAYMADLYMKFNEMNLQLQGDDLNLIKTKSVISAFVSKLLYFKNNLVRGEFYNLPNLCELRRKGRINEQNVEVYWRRLELLHQDFIERYPFARGPSLDHRPFSGVENAELQLQEELLELQANEELKPKFNLGHRASWLQRVIPHLYPGLWNVVVEGYFKEKEIALTNVISVATDRAPSMVGCQRGFISYLKKVVPNVLAIRCEIHRQHLVAKCLSEPLHRSLQLVITAVNRIKSRPLSDRLFRQLCEENGEDFHRLLLHTEVSFGVLLEFFEEENASLCANLKKFEGDIAYMADLYMKFNEMNLQLQGDDLNLIKTKSVISAFVSKLLYFKNNLVRGEFYNLPNLCELRRKGRINEQNVEVYWRRLELLHQDFIERYPFARGPSLDHRPFSGVENAELQLQEELLELQANEELKPKFNLGHRASWLQRVIPHLYPGLWNVVRKLLISFPSSYLAECGFSVVADLLTMKRNKLQIVNRGDLRLRLTSIEPDIEKLLSLRGFQA